MSLSDRLDALESIVANRGGLLDESQVASGRELYEHAVQRQSLGNDYTVVGLLGSTGSGKSSLFNAIAGEEIATVGVIRPTTTDVTATVWGAEDPAGLLDWLTVGRYWQFARGEADPIVLLDLPDFDSIDQANRERAALLAAQVDVLVWVTDPQKYADRRFHADLLRPLAHQETLILVVLNQIDRLTEAEAQLVTDSLKELLKADGLPSVEVINTSARSGIGVEELRSRIEKIAREREASRVRWEQDIRVWAIRNAPGRNPSSEPLKRARSELQTRTADAVGIAQLSGAVGAAYRHRAAQAVGWLPVAWMRRLRADPLRRLGVTGTGEGAKARRSSRLPTPSPVRDAELASAVRKYTQDVAGTLPEEWHKPLWEVAEGSEGRIADSFDRSLQTTDFKVHSAKWWKLGAGLQWVGIFALLIGVGWYVAVWGGAALRLPETPIARVQGWPLPALLLVAGLLFGWLMAGVLNSMAWIAARSRQRKATHALSAGLEDAVRVSLTGPLDEVRTDAVRMSHQFEVAAS